MSEERTSSKKPVLLAKLEEALDQVPLPDVWFEEDCEDCSKEAHCTNFNEVKEAMDNLKTLFSSFQKDNEKREKALLFVEHIEKHLHQSDGFKYKLYGNPKVICKICGKTIDQIAELEGST